MARETWFYTRSQAEEMIVRFTQELTELAQKLVGALRKKDTEAK